MNSTFPHRKRFAAAWSGAAILAVGAGLSHAGPVNLDDVTRGSFGHPPFLEWGEATERIYERENGHAAYPAEIHYDLGLYFYEMGEYELSLKHYRRAAEIAPGFSEAFFGMGLLFYSLGDDDNAIRCYQQSLERDPRDPDTRNNLGLIYYRRGELDLAREQIEEAVRLQPQFADAFYNLGLVYYQKSDLVAAVTSFQTALQQDPAYHRARFNLGVVYFELGLLEQAAEQWSMISEAAPGSPLAVQALENLSILRSDN